MVLRDDGPPTGFWPELTRHIAQREGWRIEWVEGTWSENLLLLGSNRIDVMVDVARTPSRERLFAFGNEPVHVSWSRIYSSANSSMETIPDLAGKRVGGLAGSVNIHGPDGLRATLESFAVDSRIITFEDYRSLFQALEEGRVDAAVTNREFGHRIEARFDVVPTPIIFQPVELHYAYSHEGAGASEVINRFDKRLDELKASHDFVFYQLQNEWFGYALDPPDTVLPVWVRIAIVGLAGGWRPHRFGDCLGRASGPGADA